MYRSDSRVIELTERGFQKPYHGGGMPSGGRGCAPPKSAQWVVSHYQIGLDNKQRQQETADSLQGCAAP